MSVSPPARGIKGMMACRRARLKFNRDRDIPFDPSFVVILERDWRGRSPRASASEGVVAVETQQAYILTIFVGFGASWHASAWSRAHDSSHPIPRRPE